MVSDFLTFLERLQPFFIVWDSQGQVVHISHLLKRMWPVSDDQLPTVTNRLRLQRPFEAPFNLGWIGEFNDLLIEISLDGHQGLLKGQFVPLGDGHVMLVGSPHIGYHHQLTALGFKLSDLPLHDRLGDLIIANEANKVSLSQAQEAQHVLASKNSELKKMNEVIEKFVPKQFLAALGVQSLSDAERGLHISTRLSVMFGDLRNFSTISETMNPSEVMHFVNQYLSHVSPAVQANGGVIAQYLGDGVMAVFPTSTEVALNAALAVQEALKTCAVELFPAQPERLRMGIGLHFGDVELGIIGDEDRWESAVLSDVTNTAARIESLTKSFGAELLISGDLYQNLQNPEKFEFRRLGALEVKGRQRSVEVREVLNSLPPETRARRLKTRVVFEQGVEALAAGSIEDALLAFGEVCRNDMSDLGAQYLLDHCMTGQSFI